MTTVIAAGAVAFAYREMADNVVESHDFVAILNGTTVDVPRLVSAVEGEGDPAARSRDAPGPATTAAAKSWPSSAPRRDRLPARSLPTGPSRRTRP